MLTLDGVGGGGLLGGAPGGGAPPGGGALVGGAGGSPGGSPGSGPGPPLLLDCSIAGIAGTAGSRLRLMMPLASRGGRYYASMAMQVERLQMKQTAYQSLAGSTPWHGARWEVAMRRP